ncbi:YqcI/YcgG family protein [Halorubellus sp. JP-L1]|uniref:YqcI/YcgG family protein n=1 Tax=Halorubellus sp. JP-L1 TaxID=2715753 RepID=UPI00140BA0E1|nr:YqcI/YcgG family protein [Halorubellus sp. JP-L1]NHN41892.1 YqcI/YcgG family protein [Halorubellus sp. JP-L1]
MSTGVTGGREALAGTDVVRLYEQDRVERRVDEGTLPAWACRQYEAFDEKLLGDRDGTAFPCHFGVDAQQNGGALYAFVPNPTEPGAFAPDALDALADVLAAYLATFRMHGPRTSLVTLFEPPSDPAAWGEREYREAFWGVLQSLHDADDAPWPADIPTDPAHPQFEFCCGGEPMFVTGAAPFYDERASRYNGVGLEVTFQPRAVFAGITGDTDAGQRARDQIHERIAGYDGTGPHPHIGDWEDDDSHEWKQYLLPTGEETYADDACPLDVDPDAVAEAEADA